MVEKKLWLDDVRNPVDFGCIGWMWVKTYEEAINAFENFNIVEASLDHDLSIAATLGHPDPDEKTGYSVVCWMEEHRVYPRDGVKVHSMNPSGAARMKLALESVKRRSMPE